jgi:hypothetical protein
MTISTMQLSIVTLTIMTNVNFYRIHTSLQINQIAENIIMSDRVLKYYHQKNLFFFSLGPPLAVEINMQVRSMGPISEVDMVTIFHFLRYFKNFSGVNIIKLVSLIADDEAK